MVSVWCAPLKHVHFLHFVLIVSCFSDDKVEGKVINQLLDEYVEQEEAAMACESIYRRTTQYSTPPLFEHLTSLTISAFLSGSFLKDPRVISYVLAHARRLKKLRLGTMMEKMDEAFTRRLIGAPLEKLDLSLTEITDATIDVLCQQLASSLRSLKLQACEGLTQQGLIKVKTTTTVDL